MVILYMKKFNFYHAIWDDENLERVFTIYKEILTFFSNKEHIPVRSKKCVVSFNKMIDGALYCLYSFGMARDNVLIVKHTGYEDYDFSLYDNEEYRKEIYETNELFEVKNIISKYSPDIVIEGVNECIVLCNECCDSSPHNKVKRRYCEYFIEGYCSLQLANLEKDRTCSQYFCSSFREDYVDTFSGPYGVRPLIERMYLFSKEVKKLLKILLKSTINTEEELVEVLKEFSRFKEVMLYKEVEEKDDKSIYDLWYDMFMRRRNEKEKCSLEDKECDSCSDSFTSNNF